MILLENISAGIYIIFHAPDSGSGFGSSNVLGEKEEEKTVRKVIILLTVAAILIVSVFTNDLHQLVFRFSKQPHFRMKITAMALFLW